MPRITRTVVVALGVVAILAVVIFAQRRTAPLPPVFADRLTIRQAAARSAETGRPVLVFATADWCGPCQQFKRTTLVEERVEAMINERFVPVYLNVDLEQDAAASLGIRSIPASIVLRADQPAARLEGAVGAEQYLAWLNASLAPPD